MRPYPLEAELVLDAQELLHEAHLAERRWAGPGISAVNHEALIRAAEIAQLAARNIARWADHLIRVRDERLGLAKSYPGQGRPATVPYPGVSECAPSSGSPSPSSPSSSS